MGEGESDERSEIVVQWVDPAVAIPPMIPLSKRDFVVASHSAAKEIISKHQNSEKVKIFLSSSLTVPCTKCPPRKGFVRGVLVCGGWVIKPINLDPQAPLCGCTWISVTDPRGSIPKQIIALGGSMATSQIVKVKDAAEKSSAQGICPGPWTEAGTPRSYYHKRAKLEGKRTPAEELDKAQ